MKKLILFFVLILSAVVSAQDHWYVDIAAADTSGTGTWSSPFKYHGQLQWHIGTGDFVHSIPGVYDESAYSKVLGTNICGITSSMSDITFIAEGHGVVIKTTSSVTDACFILCANNLEMRGYIFEYLTGGGAVYIGQFRTGKNTKFIGCVFGATATTTATYLSTGAKYSTPAVSFFDCQFKSATSSFFGSSIGAVPMTFDHCTFGPGVNAIFASSSSTSGATLTNCIVNSGKVVSTGTATVTISRCLYYGPTDAGSYTWTDSANEDAGITWYGTPTYSFDLSPTSLAIGKADDGLDIGALTNIGIKTGF